MTRGLADVRRARLMTVRSLAEQAGLSTRTVFRVEHGLQAPHPGTIRKLCAALDVSPEDVREFREAMGLPAKGDDPS